MFFLRNAVILSFFVSSGRRETPFLDARMRAQRYSASLNIFNATTPSPVTSSLSTTTERFTTASPSPHKMDESGEELNAELLDDDDDATEDEEDDDDAEEDLEEDGDDDSDVRDDFLVGKSVIDFSKACCMEIDQPVFEFTLANSVLFVFTVGFFGSEFLFFFADDDNQLPLAVPQSKFEKLAEECQQSIYQLPCKPNQKWYCQLEHGRWRKHKCKQQLQYPSTPNNKVFKKCACITAEGLVYKRILVRSFFLQPKIVYVWIVLHRSTIHYQKGTQDLTDSAGIQISIASSSKEFVVKG